MFGTWFVRVSDLLVWILSLKEYEYEDDQSILLQNVESLTIGSFLNQHYSKEILKWCYCKPLLTCEVSNPR